MISICGLTQINRDSNSLGNFLDIVLVKNANSIDCCKADALNRFEDPTQHHNPLEMHITEDTPVKDREVSMTKTRIDLYTVANILNENLASEMCSTITSDLTSRELCLKVCRTSCMYVQRQTIVKIYRTCVKRRTLEPAS